MFFSWQLLLKISREAQSRPDVRRLGSFVPTGQKDDQLAPSRLKIDPVTRTIVDPQFRDTFTNRTNVSSVSRGEALDPRLNPRPCAHVPPAVEPLGEVTGLPDFNQVRNVATRLHIVNNREDCFPFNLARLQSLIHDHGPTP